MERGDRDGLRARADTGDTSAALQLARLLAKRGDLDGLRGRADAGGREATLQTELGMEVGLRPGEIHGLYGHRVDWLRTQTQVIDVMTRPGLRQHPKSKRSTRVPPVPPRILDGMSVVMGGRARDALVFTAPEGGPVSDGHFRNRVWVPGHGRCPAVRELGSRTAREVPEGRAHPAGLRRPSAHDPPVRAPGHAAHRGVLARPGRRSAVRRPGSSRARVLRHDAAERSPGSGGARQGWNRGSAVVTHP